MNSLQCLKAKLEGAYSFMLKNSKITVCFWETLFAILIFHIFQGSHFTFPTPTRQEKLRRNQIYGSLRMQEGIPKKNQNQPQFQSISHATSASIENVNFPSLNAFDERSLIVENESNDIRMTHSVS